MQSLLSYGWVQGRKVGCKFDFPYTQLVQYRITCMKSRGVAQQMEITQPTISNEIADLEEYLDVQLLIHY
ncbi:helix-turn-helix domain-containing protein [Mastigocladopsis repens]|uniref:helix-turn-helix domain-containing protein n=1 Tax=Mastigocladopsis repens TaxID=221287 RepID=UPI00037420AD